MSAQITKSAVKALAEAVVAALDVPVAARFEDWSRRSSLIEERAAVIRAVMHVVADDPSPQVVGVATRRMEQIPVEHPVTFAPYVEEAGS